MAAAVDTPSCNLLVVHSGKPHSSGRAKPSAQRGTRLPGVPAEAINIISHNADIPTQTLMQMGCNHVPGSCAYDISAGSMNEKFQS